MKSKVRFLKASELLIGLVFIITGLFLFFISFILMNKDCDIYKQISIITSLIIIGLNLFYISMLSNKVKKSEVFSFIHFCRWFKFFTIILILINLISFKCGYAVSKNTIQINNTIKVPLQSKQVEIVYLKEGHIDRSRLVSDKKISFKHSFNHHIEIDSLSYKTSHKYDQILGDSLLSIIRNLKPSNTYDSIFYKDVINYNYNIEKLKFKPKKNKKSEGKKKVILENINID